MLAGEGVFGNAALTGVVAAMDEELAPLRARLVGGRAVTLAGARVTLGRLGGAPVALAVTGDGERNARVGLTALLAAFPVRRLIVVGVAGGLSANLGVGALVAGERIIGEVAGSVHHADAELTTLATTVGGATRGVAVTAGRIADTAAEKRRLLAIAAGGQDGGTVGLAALVDLESAAFAAVAEGAGVPWAVLRAVSDTADESVPALLNRSRDDGGAVRRGRVAYGLLGNPRALMPLLALGRRVRQCADVLAHAVGLTVGALGADLALRPGTPDPDGTHIGGLHIGGLHTGGLNER